MKLHARFSLTKVLPIFRRMFPAALLRQLDVEFVPQGYDRKAESDQLVEALLKAIILRLSCLEAIVEECPRLNLSGASSLSYDLDRPWFKDITQELHANLVESKPLYTPGGTRRPRFLLDTMPVMLQKTQRGDCSKYNNVAKGVGIMNVINLDADAGQCAFEIVKTMPGGWNDTYQVRNVALIADGPVYVADRGFYSLETIKLWRDQGVHFLTRAKKQNLSYEPLRKVGRRSRKKNVARGVRIESDEIVRLGKPTSKHRSEVRLLKAYLPSGEDLWLVSDDYEARAEQLLDDYLERGQIEVYHKFIKQSLCAAHLYNFDEVGIQAQLYLTVVLANLLFLLEQEEAAAEGMDLMKIVDKVLKTLRRQLQVRKPWKRNTVAQRRNKPAHNRRHLKTSKPAICAEPNL